MMGARSKGRSQMYSNVKGSSATLLDVHETLTSMMRGRPAGRQRSADRFMLAGAFVLLLGAIPDGCVFAQAPVDRMDQIVRSYSNNHQFMGSILVAQGDKV